MIETKNALPTRRTLLTCAAGAATATGTAASEPSVAADADAELLALCAAWHANNAEYERLCGMERALEEEALSGGKPLCGRERIDLTATVAEGHDLLEQISGIPAKTPAGRLAKARVLIARLAPGGADDVPPPWHHEERLAYSLALDEVALTMAAA